MSRCMVMFILATCLMSTGMNTFAQENLPEQQCYGTIGIGYGSGTYISTSFIYVNGLFGINCSFRELWYKAKDLPLDYTGFYKNNDMTMLSVLAVLEGKINTAGNVWFGLEIGPSYINHRKEVEIPNPDYGTWILIIPDLNKYIRDNLVRNTVGMTTRVKIDITFANSVGLEFALFGVLNKYKPYAGIEGHFIFGKVR
jgi:hypothetical protein